MSYEEDPTNTGITQDDKENLPESLVWLVQLVGQHLEEGGEGWTWKT